MSENSDDEYASADENTADVLVKPEHFDGVTPSDFQTNTANASRDQQPEVVQILDNKYVSDAESLKNGGVVELTEEQRKVSTSLLYPCMRCMLKILCMRYM